MGRSRCCYYCYYYYCYLFSKQEDPNDLILSKAENSLTKETKFRSWQIADCSRCDKFWSRSPKSGKKFHKMRPANVVFV